MPIFVLLAGRFMPVFLFIQIAQIQVGAFMPIFMSLRIVEYELPFYFTNDFLMRKTD